MHNTIYGQFKMPARNRGALLFNYAFGCPMGRLWKEHAALAWYGYLPLQTSSHCHRICCIAVCKFNLSNWCQPDWIELFSIKHKCGKEWKGETEVKKQISKRKKTCVLHWLLQKKKKRSKNPIHLVNLNDAGARKKRSRALRVDEWGS